MRLLHGVYPEQYVEILRFAQNDRRRRVRNDISVKSLTTTFSELSKIVLDFRFPIWYFTLKDIFNLRELSLMVKLKFGRHTQALKSQRQDKKRHLRNVAVKTKIRTIAKKVGLAVAQGKPEEAKSIFLRAMKELDKAASKKIIPKRRASRKKSRLAKKINTLKAKE